MGKTPHSSRIKARISDLRYALVAAFAVLGAIIFTVWTVHNTYRDAHVRMRYDIAATASSITHGLRALELVISTVAEHVAASGRTQDRQPYLQAVVARLPQMRTIAIIRPDGVIDTDLRPGQPAKGMMVLDRDYVQAHLNGFDGPYFYSPPIHSRLDGLTQITISRAARAADGRLVAVIAASIDDHFFSQWHGQFGQGKLYQARILYRDGRTLYNFATQKKAQPHQKGIFYQIARLADPPHNLDSQRIPILYTDLSIELHLSEQSYLQAAALKLPSGYMVIGMVTLLLFAMMRFRAFAMQQRRKAREENRLLGARLRALYNTAPDAIITVDSQLKIIEFNKTAEEMFGWKASEILDLRLKDLLPINSKDNHDDVARNFMHTHTGTHRFVLDRTVEARHRDGHLFKVRISLSRVILDTGPVVMAIIRDVYEIEKMNSRLLELSRDLQKQTRAAEEANEAKSQFLATMSHELRTPLNAIIGFSQMIEEEVFGPVGHEKYKSYVGDIHKSGQHLLSLINDVLDLARLEHGEDSLNMEPVDLRPAIAKALIQMRPLAIQKKLRLRVKIDRNLAPIQGNRRAIHQILLNLLSNAIKFSAKGKRILVSAKREGAHITLSVEDQGCGIPEHKIALLGRPFQRLEKNSHHANENGLGLGLAICKRLASDMGGTLVIFSQEGKQTRVQLTLNPASSNMEQSQSQDIHMDHIPSRHAPKIAL
ncbi:hypothetical protein GCM10007972_20500 [Iodidimonas muriae]|uniref:histidine kinase n=1 Tax=Iodidimonas muriae TaxID=261467 RepID=A0ABQ2LEF0_9PROT|nr:ATP-binding protein [Iodidimonas muriae]GGO13869.1 hypothetical protein GCM10007972_20500 [Iodidimonas muriae]